MYRFLKKKSTGKKLLNYIIHDKPRIIQYNLVQLSGIRIAMREPCNISHNVLQENDIGIGCY